MEPLRASRVRNEQAPKVHALGRVCDEEGCDTILSRYSNDPRCWTHRKRVTLYVNRWGHFVEGKQRGRRTIEQELGLR